MTCDLVFRATLAGVPRMLWGAVGLAAVMASLAAACQPAPAPDTSGRDAMKPTVSVTPSAGTMSLTRSFTKFSDLLKAADTAGECSKPDHVPSRVVSFYLADGMAPTIAATAICDIGRGAVIGLLKPGRMAEFQRAYQKAVATDPILWYAESHQLMVGNGFFVFPLTTVTPGWEQIGLRFLRCDPDQAKLPDYQRPIPADVTGCGLAEEPWRTV